MIADIRSKINGLPQLHRGALLVLGSALTLALGWFGVGADIRDMSAAMQKDRAEYHRHIGAANDLITNTERLVYQNQLADLDEVIQFLQDNIALQNNLQLIAIEKHAPVKLSASVFGAHELGLGALYAYDVTIDLMGDYFNFLDYLKMVSEQSRYNFYWVKIAYDVVDYPTSEIKMVVRTIGHKT